MWKMDRTTGRTPFRVNWDLCALCQEENKNDKLVALEEIADQANPTSGLLSMLRSDWLGYY